MRLSMRPAGDEDREWLFQVHAATMPGASRERFAARTEPDVRIIAVDDIDVGAVHLSEDDDGSLRIGLIEVLPEHQGNGIGSSVLRALDEEAARAGSSLTLRVRKANPRAKALYDRLGFTTVAEDDTHFHVTRF